MDITCLWLEADLLQSRFYPLLTNEPPLHPPFRPFHRMANEGKGQHRDTHVVVVVRGSSATSTGVRVQCPCARPSLQSLVTVARREGRRWFDMRVEETPVASELWQLC